MAGSFEHNAGNAGVRPATRTAELPACIECHHCDRPFSVAEMLRGAQSLELPGTMILRCKGCGLMTPILVKAA
jgi:hypothetical protein